jgi:D-sedoheptulose 7-phosphate isomerase
MQSAIVKSVEEGILAIQQLLLPASLDFIAACADAIADSYRQGKKILVAGNGGSLCDAMHFAEELTGFFRQKRRALPAIALSCPGHMSCVANDLAFDEVFARGVQAYGQPGDILIVLTTSGNSPNIIRAVEEAQKMGLKTIAFLGKGGGRLKGIADHELIIEGSPTSDRIQEAHMCAIHIIIEMMERTLFSAETLNSGLISSAL